MSCTSAIGEEATYLDVPFPDNDRARALGARWDKTARSWYAPPGADLEPFAHWLAVLPDDDAPLLRVAGMPQRCWKCRQDTMTVIACEHEDHLVFAHGRVLQVLASQLTDTDLARIGAGLLIPRFSRTVDSSYWSNGCVACDALLGDFPLREEFLESLRVGFDFPFIATARVPLAVLYDEDDSDEEPL